MPIQRRGTHGALSLEFGVDRGAACSSLALRATPLRFFLPLIGLRITKSRRMSRSYITVAAGVFCLAAVDHCLADSFTFDLRATGRLEFPSWIPDRPLAFPKAQSELSFPVVPGSDADDLALAVVFQA